MVAFAGFLGVLGAMLQQREEHQQPEPSRAELVGLLQLPSTETPSAVSTWPIWLAKV